jgi:Na+-transporting methylmalonyl-CoA/oxaloacetate decarboxylase gamma subunit
LIFEKIRGLYMEMLLTWGEVFTVVLTGLVIVFAALVILIAVVWAYGKIFTAINKHKQDKDGKKAADSVNSGSAQTAGGSDSAQSASGSDSAQSANVSDSAQMADSGIPKSVIAAITAAVAAFTDDKGVVTGISVKKPRATSRRRSTEWRNKGTLSAMKNLSRTGW